MYKDSCANSYCCSTHARCASCRSAHGPCHANTWCTAHAHWGTRQCCGAHSGGRETNSQASEWGDRFIELQKLWSGQCEVSPAGQTCGCSNVRQCEGCVNCCYQDTRVPVPHYSHTEHAFVIPKWSREDRYVQDCPCALEKYVPLRECNCWKRNKNTICNCKSISPQEYQPNVSCQSLEEKTSEETVPELEEVIVESVNEPECACGDDATPPPEVDARGCCGPVSEILEDCNPKNMTYPACAYSCDCINRDRQRSRLRSGTLDHRTRTPRCSRRDPPASRRSLSLQILDTPYRVNRNDVSYDEVIMKDFLISLKPKTKSNQPTAHEQKTEETPEVVDVNSRIELTGESTSKEKKIHWEEEDDVGADSNEPEEKDEEEGKKEIIKKEKDSIFSSDDSSDIDSLIKETKHTLVDDKKKDPKKSDRDDAMYLYHNKDLFTPSSSCVMEDKDGSSSRTSITALRGDSDREVRSNAHNTILCLCKKVTKEKPAPQKGVEGKRRKRFFGFNLEKKKNSSDMTDDVGKEGTKKMERVCGPCGRSRPHAKHK